VYVKLTRGYYDQLGASDAVSAPISGLLAQHELNIEIFDAFVDTARWIIRQSGLEASDDRSELVRALSALFPRAPPARSLGDLQTVVVQHEQDQIADYFRERAFGRPGAPTPFALRAMSASKSRSYSTSRVQDAGLGGGLAAPSAFAESFRARCLEWTVSAESVVIRCAGLL
jgi:hypothetical protein